MLKIVLGSLGVAMIALVGGCNTDTGANTSQGANATQGVEEMGPDGGGNAGNTDFGNGMPPAMMNDTGDAMNDTGNIVPDSREGRATPGNP